jgi:subtilisin family serine protease
MRRILVPAACVGVVLALAATPAAATPIRPHPPLAAQPAMVDAVVVLSAQADLSRVAGSTRPARLSAVEGALRSTAAGTQRGVLALLRARQAQHLVSRITPLWIVNEVGVRATPAVLRELAERSDVRAVQPDVTITAPVPSPALTPQTLPAGAPEANIAKINAPALWNLGYTGQGVVVASMDTGVDVTHPDLAGRWRGGSDSWYDPNGQHPTTPTDVNGHGTQTMGVIVGGDAGGTSIGVAPGAKWIAVKIFNDRGTTTSTVIHQGFQWLLDPDHNPATPDAPNVVNDSWTMSTAGCSLDFQPDLRNLRAAGILPVFAAGNFGPTSGTVLNPANLPEAFAVGGTDDSDLLDPESSRGPSACAGAVAPKLTAPGVGVHTSDIFGGYIDDTGTSVAAPHVSGALALLLSAFPGLPADRQEAALEAGAIDLGTTGLDNDYGYGRLDVLAAYQYLAATPDYTLAASPSSASTQPGGGATYAISSTGTNGFAGDVALSVSGLPAGASATLTPAVIAGGTGSAQLQVTTTASVAAGTYPLTVSGTSGTTTRTATVTLQVTPPPDFTLAVSPSSLTVVAGQAGAATVTVGALNGFTGTVGLTLSGLSAGVGTATFTPAAIGGAGTSQLSISVLSSAPSGSYPLTVTGGSGGTSHSAALTLVVPVRDFGLAVSPAGRTVTRGQSTTYTVTVTAVNGFTGSVSLTVTGLPARATASWSRNPVAGAGTSTLTIRTTSTTARGTFTLGITGTSGSLSHLVTTGLTVR